MPNINGINRVMNRIRAIQTQFKPPTASIPSFQSGQMPFDASLKMAMGKNMSQVSYNTGAQNVQSFYNSIGKANMGVGGLTSAAMGKKLAKVAKNMDGKEFKPGMTARCADFVSTMITKSGSAPKNFKHQVNCFELQKYGEKVDKNNLKEGDIVYFSNTYLPTTYTHVGIYLGDGKFVHRPTANKPVRIDSLDKGYYATKYEGARRLG